MKSRISSTLKNISGQLLIYGAHLVALECCRILVDNGKGSQIVGFAVTEKKGNPEQLEGYPVKEIDAYIDQCDELTVIIAMPGKFHSTVAGYAKEKGFRKFIRVGLEEMSALKSRRMISECRNHPELTFHLKENDHDISWMDIMVDAIPSHIYFKFPTLFYKNTKDIFRAASNCDFAKEYQETLGQYRNLHKIPGEWTEGAEPLADLMQVYMIFSENDSASLSMRGYNPWIVPLHAGRRKEKDAANFMSSQEERRDLKRVFQCFYDDMGETITDQNRIFAEMTGAYWIWKNRNHAAYKGLCHYRRRFIISEEEIQALEQNRIDAILTTPRYVPYGVGNMFLAETPVKKSVYESMLQAVEECAPEDALRFQIYLDSCFYYPNNMVIARNAIYNAYCQWVFKILFRMSEIETQKGNGQMEDRRIAYGAELLTSFYFAKNKDNYRIAVTDYQFYT